jgi:hypothetical protein
MIFFIPASCNTTKWVSLDNEESSKCLQAHLSESTRSAYDSIVLIPDEETAINIAEPILFKIYGKSKIIKERPYKIGYTNKYWVIIGSLPKYITKGGTFEIIINSGNAEIINVTHGK